MVTALVAMRSLESLPCGTGLSAIKDSNSVGAEHNFCCVGRSVALGVKANTEQRGPLLGIGKCISSQLYKGQAGRAAPS
jgi:hypothetical protein